MGAHETIRSNVAYVKAYSGSINPSIRAEKVLAELEAACPVPEGLRARVHEVIRSNVAYVKSYSRSISPSIRAEKVLAELAEAGYRPPR